jgi:predicted tellurium resistance membrane protein TerC
MNLRPNAHPQQERDQGVADERGVLARFHLLRYGLALVLVFVGLKMVWLDAAFGGKFPIGLSLALIATLLVGSVVASLLVRPRAQPSVAPPRSKEPAPW